MRFRARSANRRSLPCMASTSRRVFRTYPMNACASRRVSTRSRRTRSSSSTSFAIAKMLCSPRRAPVTDSNIRRQWENRWRCGRCGGHQQSICHLSGWIGSRAKAFADIVADASPIGALGLGLSVSLKMRCQFPDDKFLEDTCNGALTKLDQAVLPHHSMAIGLRIVGIRDGAGCEGSDDFGVIELPFLIVALANHGIAERV